MTDFFKDVKIVLSKLKKYFTRLHFVTFPSSTSVTEQIIFIKKTFGILRPQFLEHFPRNLKAAMRIPQLTNFFRLAPRMHFRNTRSLGEI
jgi:hypothetical protein